MVILDKALPMFTEVARLKRKCLAIYAILWQSAAIDKRYDKRVDLPWDERRDCGGTSEWTIKGIADTINSTRETVSASICLLLDHGYVQVAGYANSSKGTKHTIFRVTHPDELDNVRAGILIMGDPSKRWKAQMKAKKRIYEGEVWDIVGNDPVNFQDHDANYHGLYGEDHAKQVQQRIDYYQQTIPCFAENVVKHSNIT